MTAFSSETVRSRTCWYYLFYFLQNEIWWQSGNCHDENNFLQTSPCPPAIWRIYCPHYTPPNFALCFFLFVCLVGFFFLSVKVSFSLAAWLIFGFFAWISCVVNLCAMYTCTPNRGLRQPRHFPWVMEQPPDSSAIPFVPAGATRWPSFIWHLCPILNANPSISSVSEIFSNSRNTWK